MYFKNIINLTSHEINLDNVTIMPSGKVARIYVREKIYQRIIFNGKYIVFFKPECEVENLPEEQNGIFLIVSAKVKIHYPNRKDLVAPTRLIKDKNGTVIGCEGLSINV